MSRGTFFICDVGRVPSRRQNMHAFPCRSFHAVFLIMTGYFCRFPDHVKKACRRRYSFRNSWKDTRVSFPVSIFHHDHAFLF